MTRVLAFLIFLLLPTTVFAQGQQCRTSPAGASTAYCSSEAFVTQSITAAIAAAIADLVTGPSNAVAGHVAVFGDTTGKVIADGGALPPIPRSYLAGLKLSAAGASATFGIAAGMAADATDVALMQLASAYTKTASAWAVGTGNGGLDTGTIANATWYHVFLMQRPDTGVVDICESVTVTGCTTSGSIPVAYTLFRRIGSMLTDGSAHWTKFSQLGDEFLWDVNVVNVANFTGSTAIQTQIVTVPTGVQVRAILNVLGTQTAGEGRGWVFSPDVNSAGSLASTNQDINFGVVNGPANTAVPSVLTVRTNTSAQVKYALTGAGANIGIATTGWTDSRGKDN